MKRLVFKRAAFLSILLTFCAFRASYGFDLDRPVKEIRITGNQRANSNTVRFYIHSKPGEPYSLEKTREDIRRIHNLGYFDDIQLKVEEESDGLVLIFHLKEKPFVKTVTLQGNVKIASTDLEDMLKLKKGTFFQNHLVKKDIRQMKNHYRKKGFYFTRIGSKIKDAGNNQVDVTYVIAEKQKIKINKITFRGNKHFKDYELATSVETNKVNFWSFVSDNGNFEREILKTDMLRLESKYRDAGYMRALIEEPRVEVDEESGMIKITIVIHEGDRFYVGSVTAEGDYVHTASEILENIKLKKGDPYNQSLFRGNLFKITEMYSDMGYAYTAPIPSIKDDSTTKTVNIHVRIDPGDKVYIGRIRIAGNEKTAESVIRREFRIHEGELFSGSKMQRTRQRLLNLGFFDDVQIRQKSGKDPDLMNLEVSVVEKQTGNIRAGVGYSSVEKVLVQAQISERNLLGKGYNLALGVESTTLREDYYLNFTQPKFMDRDILLGLKAYSRQFNYYNYISYNKGGGINVGRSMGEYTSMRLGYQFEGVRIKLQDGTDAGSYLALQEGNYVISSIEPVITKDTRDSFFRTTKGSRIQMSTKLAGGPLGGERDFYKLTLEGSRYYQLPLNFVIMFHSVIKNAESYGTKDLPLSERFYLGGFKTLRGFSFEDVGPMDSNGTSIGGASSLLFNIELSYDISDALRMMIFYDRGQVYGSEGDLSKTTDKKFDLEKMRHSFGFGIRFVTPAMPIILAWGFKLDPQPGESAMEFHFTMGQSF
ncbi:MAG: outer membrane protein assembly factor BamA [bacterium]|nr:MAG: outer membrane protein assembly factor BamA [bacterium]